MHIHTASRLVNKPPPRRELYRRFASKVESAFKPIVFRDVYIDTVQILLKRPLSRDQVGELVRLNEGEVILEPTKARSYYKLLRFHQPTQAAIDYLTRVAPDHLLNRLDFALDLSVKSRDAADALGDFLRHYLIQKWHGKRTITKKGAGLYYGNMWTSRQLVTYSDKPSKITGMPAVHIELRVCGARPCQLFGASKLAHLAKVDVAEAFDRSCRLSTVNSSRLHRRLDKRAKQSLLAHEKRTRAKSQITRSQFYSRLRGLLAGELQNGEDSWHDIEDVPVQRLIDRRRSLVENALINLSVAEVLGRQNPVKTRNLC